MGIENEMLGMLGNDSDGSPGSVTLGRLIDASNDGIEMLIENDMLGIDGRLSDGRPGSVTLGSDIDASKLGIEIPIEKEILGILGRDSDGRPGNDNDGKSQLTRSGPSSWASQQTHSEAPPAP